MNDLKDEDRLRHYFWSSLGESADRLAVLVSLDLLPATTKQVPHSLEHLAISGARKLGKLHDLWEAVMAHIPPDKRKPNPFPP